MAASAQPLPEPPELLLGRIARQRAMAEGGTDAGGSRLYRLQPGWESALLRDDPELVKVRTARQLDMALADPDAPVVMVVREAGLPFAQVVASAERCALTKTVFIED